MAITVDADPAEVRKVAEQLRADCQTMLDKTSEITNAWLAFTAYKGPDSKQIGEGCKALLLQIDKLAPQIEDASKLLKAYAEWLEKK